MDRPTLISDRWRAEYAAERLAEFTGRCRKRGLAITPQRVAVMRVLVNSGDHPRAETVFAKVRREYPNISLATVHRTLETLCAIGEARKVTPLHDSARYDGNTDPHHHVVCVRCRRISGTATIISPEVGRRSPAASAPGTPAAQATWR